MLKTAILAALVATVSAKDYSKRTFAVLRFNGDGAMTVARADPIVNPGAVSPHLHSIMGGSNFGLSVTGEQLMSSPCTNAMIKGDNSNYWFPTLFFEDPVTKQLEQVPMFYTNIYYLCVGSDL